MIIRACNLIILFVVCVCVCVCVCDAFWGFYSIGLLELNAPVTTANEKVDAVILAVASGIVAANVHWILVPSMRPLTAFAFT